MYLCTDKINGEKHADKDEPSRDNMFEDFFTFQSSVALRVWWIPQTNMYLSCSGLQFLHLMSSCTLVMTVFVFLLVH